MYTVYILKTSKDTLYTGITNNLQRRIKEHHNKGKKSAKYMRSFESFSLVYREEFKTKSLALKREFEIKSLTRKQKNSLINMSYWGYNNYYNGFGSNLGLFSLLIPFAVFDLILRGFALWRSAKKDQNVWFVALLIVNSMGILPLIYLILNRDQKPTSKKTLKSK